MSETIALTWIFRPFEMFEMDPVSRALTADTVPITAAPRQSELHDRETLLLPKLASWGQLQTEGVLYSRDRDTGQGPDGAGGPSSDQTASLNTQ